MKMKILVFLIVVLSCSYVYGTVWFDDGGVHDVDYQINEEVKIWDDESTGNPTTVNLLDGGYIQGICQVGLNSRLNMYGGTIDNYLYTYEYGQAYIYGGVVDSHVHAYDNSSIHFAGGELKIDIISDGNSMIFISGGIIQRHIVAIGESQIMISGGQSAGEINAQQNSIIYYSGGTRVSPNYLYVHSNGQIVVVGSHFRVDDVYHGFGEIFGVDQGVLTGKLQNGDPIDMGFRFWSGDPSIITVIDMPTLSYCTQYPTMDINKDCKVDIIDFVELASQWLDCNLEPQSACL